MCENTARSHQSPLRPLSGRIYRFYLKRYHLLVIQTLLQLILGHGETLLQDTDSLGEHIQLADHVFEGSC